MARPTKLRRVLALASGLPAAVVLAAPAGASPPTTTRLTVERADGATSCPAEAELRATVGARLGHDPFAPDAPSATHVTWWRDARGKLLSRVVRTAADGTPLGSRTLESDAEDCAELASATSFAIAVAIDPTSVIAPEPSAPRPGTAPPAEASAGDAPPSAAPDADAPPAPAGAAAEPPPEVVTAPPPRVTGPADSREGSGPWLFVGGSAHAAFLAAPTVAPGGVFHVGIRVDWASLAAEGRFDAEVRGSDEGAAGEVGTRLTLGALVPCGHVGPAAFCAVAGIGALEVQGYGVDRPAADGTVIGAFGPRVAIELPIARLGVFAHVDALATVPRATVDLDDTPAYRQSVGHVVVGAGVRLHLGELDESSGR